MKRSLIKNLLYTHIQTWPQLGESSGLAERDFSRGNCHYRTRPFLTALFARTALSGAIFPSSHILGTFVVSISSFRSPTSISRLRLRLDAPSTNPLPRKKEIRCSNGDKKHRAIARCRSSRVDRDEESEAGICLLRGVSSPFIGFANFATGYVITAEEARPRKSVRREKSQPS